MNDSSTPDSGEPENEVQLVGLDASQVVALAGKRLNGILEGRQGTTLSSVAREEWRNDVQVAQLAILTDLYCVSIQLNERLAELGRIIKDTPRATEIQ